MVNGDAVVMCHWILFFVFRAANLEGAYGTPSSAPLILQAYYRPDTGSFFFSRRIGLQLKFSPQDVEQTNRDQGSRDQGQDGDPRYQGDQDRGQDRVH